MKRIAFVLMLAACSSSSDDGPICPSNSFQLSGSVGDGTSETDATASNYQFVNAIGGSPGTLDVGFGPGDSLHLTWQSLAFDDKPVPATGMLVQAAPEPSYCITSAQLDSRSSQEGGGVSFVLDGLATGACPGAKVSGKLEGCAASASP
ncbi:MAG TPA: hypothetical protein VGF94_20555 [Kofleriaceae bacterium]